MEGQAIHAESSTSRSRPPRPAPSTPSRSQGTKRRQSTPAETHDDSEEDAPPVELDEVSYHISDRSSHQLYVTLRTDVVGVQHYRGLVGRGEYVVLRRQPNNPYDSNAVQVINATGQQVGHVPRAVAAKIAPLMDHNLITVEGRMIGQNLDRSMHYKLKMDMLIYARPSHRYALEPELEWATPGQQGFERMRQAQAAQAAKGKGAGDGGGLSEQEAELGRLLNKLTEVKEEKKFANNVMSVLTADLDVANLPPHPSPPSLASGDLLVDLLPHQSQALQWMVEHENPVLPKKVGDAPVQFWARHAPEGKTQEYWVNIATKTPQVDNPTLGRGGIIADGMGLGKTLTTLALVLATRNSKPASPFSNATLIVCPLSVLSNWEKQIEDHVVIGKLKSYTYHGAGKGIGATALSKYDIVLTTYQTIAAEMPAPESSTPSGKGKKAKTTSASGPLLKVKWKRVVADEGHVMKNTKAKMTQAFGDLQAERRWVCTGTPIVNSAADLGTLLTCLRLCVPLDDPQIFKSLILRPIKAGSGEASRLLQAVVGQVLLRRTKESKDKKGKKLVTLPKIEYYQCPVKLDPETRKLYDDVQVESAKRFQESVATGGTGANVLSMLTRMRQLCLSADMIPADYLETLRNTDTLNAGPSVSISSLQPEQKDKLIEKLRQAIADQEECSVCFDVLDDPRITDCGHPFCLLCITEVINRQALCPMDRHPLSLNSLLELPPDIDLSLVEDNVVKPRTRSAKIAELVRYLKAFDANDKTLVFSQFTTFLDRVAGVLQEEGIPFCRFDGTMPAKKRQQVIAQFQTPVTGDNRDGNPVVMLISLKSGAVGLNLTAASNVFLCDPWWQSAIEAQAVDRVHRMGQRKTVRVFQLIAEDTIESKVLDIQKRKDDLVAKAFEKSGTREVKAAKKQGRFEDLKELFGVAK
ncbi:hypothetical protein Q8F55_002409 [Vanrija albida]|uniref:Uncharacterized protein n=1 Tax=Vanrija albida TaxID=181172 RepID=A0ABR3QAQ7_9TREE